MNADPDLLNEAAEGLEKAAEVIQRADTAIVVMTQRLRQAHLVIEVARSLVSSHDLGLAEGEVRAFAELQGAIAHWDTL